MLVDSKKILGLRDVALLTFVSNFGVRWFAVAAGVCFFFFFGWGWVCGWGGCCFFFRFILDYWRINAGNSLCVYRCRIKSIVS